MFRFLSSIIIFCKWLYNNYVVIKEEDQSSNLGWYGLQLGKNYREYCNKQALICNSLRAVPNFGGDTPSHKATAVQAQVLSEKSEN